MTAFISNIKEENDNFLLEYKYACKEKIYEETNEKGHSFYEDLLIETIIIMTYLIRFRRNHYTLKK